MTTPRAPALVRNVSVPVLQSTLHTHPRPVTRVSSFSTLVKPPPQTTRKLTHSEDEDGMVPQLPLRSHNHHHLHADHHHPHADNHHPHADHLHPHADHHHPHPPSPVPLSHHHHSTHHHQTPLDYLRTFVRDALASLSVFLPARHIPPHHQLKLIFTSAISFLLLLPATTLTYTFPNHNFHLLTLLLPVVPLLARTTASVLLSTALLVSLVLTFTFLASPLISPVVLVWSSVVPVITFATLGNRYGAASSAITAAAVAAVDFSEQRYTGYSRLIIASWLLFLGVIGVVQKQIPHVLSDHGYVLVPESSTGRRKEWSVAHHFEEQHQDDHYYDELVDHSDAEVPDAVSQHGRTF